MHNASPTVTYDLANTIWQEYPNLLKAHIRMKAIENVCDVGGGANPILPMDFIENNDLNYTLLDISSDELAKAPNTYNKVLADIAKPNGFVHSDKYDLVFTKMLAEHVKSGESLHRNIFSILKPGGYAIHFLPTLYSVPFVTNRLLPESLSSLILDLVSPRDRIQQDKFPAYYSWCVGPTSKQIRRLQYLGYRVEEIRGYFGHAYYQRIPVLRTLHNFLTRLLIKHPVPQLTSYCFMILQKPTIANVSNADFISRSEVSSLG